MNQSVVIFTTNNARVITDINDERAMELSYWPNAVLDPNLSQVEGVPPHFWKLIGREILPMGESEKLARIDNINKHGIDNRITNLSKRKFKARRKFLRAEYADWLAYVIIIALLIKILKRGL